MANGVEGDVIPWIEIQCHAVHVARLLPLSAAGLGDLRAHAGRAALGRLAARELRVLRLRAAIQPDLSRRGDARHFRLRLGSGPGKATAAAHRHFRHRACRGARFAHRLQVLWFPCRRARARQSPGRHQAAAPARHRAGWLFLLRLLGRKLPHRHLCRASVGPAESRPRGIVHRLFSQDFRRPDRTGDEFPAAAIVRAACRSGPLCARAAIDRLGPIQESRHRRQPCAIGRSQLQDSRLRPAARTLDQHIFLRLPDLLRLFRLYRYRARHLVAVRPHADGELPPAVLSRSTTEFWAERWHISLGRWFRDYLYIPLGGSRAGTLRRAINVMVVFLVSGLWHAGLGYGVGWTFLVWGALNGAYQWAGLATRGLWLRVGEALPRVAASAWLRVLRIVITFHLILLSWVFFRAGSMHDALLVLQKIGARLTDLPHLLTIYPFSAEQLTGFGLIAFLVAYE